MRAAAAFLSFVSAAALAQQDPFPLPPKEWPKPVMDAQRFTFLQFDRLEYRAQPGANLGMWDFQGWVGGDYNKLWLRSEGETEMPGRTERAEWQALYARRVSPYWHLQAGVRQEWRPEPARNDVVISAQGLAPYWFNIQAMAFLGRGEVSGRLEVEYDQLLSQRLVLQPRFETVLASAAEPERGVGRGVNHVELGLRLRYELRREFAPYVGINWTRRLGDTADLVRAQGGEVSERALVLGVRAWY